MRAALEAGTLLGGFRVVRPLSEGGMGSVYVAEQLATKKLRALKVMRPEIVASARMRERFLQEAQIGSRIESEHVVEVIDAGIDAESQTPWMAMELLKGSTLTAWVARRGPMPQAVVRELFVQLCDAMGAAHAAGIVHRDLKPDNLFLADSKREGVRFTLKVLDFGIAKLISEASTHSTTAMGTPMFMPPEQMVPGGAISSAADVWAMGLIAFFVSTGRPYWQSGNMESSTPMMLLNEVTSLPIVAPSLRVKELGLDVDLPAAFDAWFLRCVNRVVDYRFADASELRAGLDALLRPAEAGASLDSLGDTALVPIAAGGAPQDSGTIAAEPLSAMGAKSPRVARRPGNSSGEGGLSSPTSMDFVAHQTAPRARPRPYYLLLGAAAVAAGVAALALGPAGREQGTPPSTSASGDLAASAGSVEPDEGETRTDGPSEVNSARALVPPRLGLKAVADFEDPAPNAAQALRSGTMWEAAAADFHEACAQPDAPARWCAGEDFSRGQLALLRGQGKQASQLFEAARRLDAGWAAPAIGLSFARSSQNDLAGALEALKSAQRLAPGSWVAVAAGARIYAAHNRFDEAIEEYKRAEAMAPKNPLLLAQIALMYHAARMDDEATRFAQRALELEPELTLVRVLLAERALERGDGQTALLEAERAIASQPKLIAGHAARGDALLLLNRTDDARAAYQKVVELLASRDDETAPDHRLTVIREAVAKGELPKPRAQVGPSRPAPSAGDRTIPNSPERTPPPPDRSRPLSECACPPSDVMCAMKCSADDHE